MNRYYGGEPVPNGVYLNLANLEFTQVHDEAPILPGDRGGKFVKVPALLAFVAGPTSGLAFIIFLPLVGIVGMVTCLTYKALKGAQWLGGKMKTTGADLEPGTSPAPGGDADQRPAGGKDKH